MAHGVSEYERQQLEPFLSWTDALPAPSTNATFRYVAIKHNGHHQIWQARLHLAASPPMHIAPAFESATVRAGCITGAEIDLRPRPFVERLLSREPIQTPHGSLCFSPYANENSSYSIFGHPDKREPSVRKRRLKISIGHRPPQLDRDDIVWELRSSPTPFHSLDDLCDEYGVGPIEMSSAFVDLTVDPFVQIDRASTVTSGIAKIVLAMWECLDTRKAELSLRILSKGRIVGRSKLSGKEWRTDGHMKKTTIELPIPPGAEIDCYASYGGEAENHFQLFDPRTSSNPRVAAYGALDTDLILMKEVLGQPFDRTKTKDGDQRNFEDAVTTLFWLLGFATGPLGGSKLTQAHAPDILVESPSGNLAVIECSISLPSHDKLNKLAERVRAIKTGMGNSGFTTYSIIPLFVTNCKRAAIASILEHATQLKIVALTHEDITALLTITRKNPNADEVFRRAEASLQADFSLIAFHPAETYKSPFVTGID